MVTFEYVDINKKINISDVDNNKDTLMKIWFLLKDNIPKDLMLKTI